MRLDVPAHRYHPGLDEILSKVLGLRQSVGKKTKLFLGLLSLAVLSIRVVHGVDETKNPELFVDGDGTFILEERYRMSRRSNREDDMTYEVINVVSDVGVDVDGLAVVERVVLGRSLERARHRHTKIGK